MITDSKLTQAHERYRTKKAQVIAQQRVDLQKELYAYAADVGDEIARVRDAGNSIEAVGYMLGVQNRTHIYQMIKASEARSKGKVRVITPEPETDAADDDSAPYSIEWFSGAAKVTFPDGDTYDVQIIDGEGDAPDEWSEHTKERRLLYKQILQEIRQHG